MNRRPRSTHTGFSLIEVVIVLTILGTVAAITIPRFASAQQRYKAEVAARRIAADLELAREQAQAASANRGVKFDLINQQYTLLDIASPDDPSASYTVALNGGDLAAAIKTAAFDSSTILTFDGYGRPNSGGSVVITHGGFSKQVNVEAETGRITVTDVGLDSNSASSSDPSEEEGVVGEAMEEVDGVLEGFIR